MKITAFFQDQFIDFAQYQSFRSIANYIDGLKPSLRKIIYTVDKNNVTSPLKVAQLAPRVAEQTLYIHGEQSLPPAIAGLAKDYVGSNNINLLAPEGSFGTRFVPQESSARYIYTMKMPIFNKVFHPADNDILQKQYFEDSLIEYLYYAPTLPMILVNGSDGIGNSYSQRILPRNPEQIVEEIRSKLKTKRYKIKPLAPYFKGFTGSVVWEETRWAIYGKIERVKANTIKITEIPIGYDLASYLKVLNDLCEKKIIKDFDDKSEDDRFEFYVKVARTYTNQQPDPTLMDLSDEEILKTLKLKKYINENFTCIDENNQIILFQNDAELFEKYIEVRLDFYKKRRVDLESKIRRKWEINNARINFIQAFIKAPSIIHGKKKVEIVEWFEKNKYFSDDGYDYLLNMPIYSLSEEKIASLEKERAQISAELDDILNNDEKSLWLRDLKDLKL
jgi:DNA topoisomerase II